MKRDKKNLAILGQQIRRLRKERRLSQDALAERAKVSRNFVSLVERGQRSLSVMVILDIAEALNVPPGDLFAGYGPAGEAMLPLADQ